jgi:16S rRNA (cytosine1402-N4)-methyltransferase
MHQNKNQNKNKQHEPVLLSEVMHYLSPQAGESYLDLTAGYGGHAAQIIRETARPDKAVLVDRDKHAVKELTQHFIAENVTICWQDFFTASQTLVDEKKQFNLILADLGVSSPHLNEDKRGFAFSKTGPLDMRMDQRQALTAEIIVNSYQESQLIDILERYGEEPKSRQIAHLIVANRPFVTTSDLARIVSRAWPGYSRVHPATRTFQALRIAVNNELGLLEQSLPLWLQLLAPDGRIVIISFHSLEDRLIKQFFASESGNRYDAELLLLTKRPVTASPNELVLNPRARSAKLRAAVKIKNTKGELHANSGKKQLPRVQGDR